MADAGAGAGRPSLAIAHDYLTQRGGAERVVLALAEAFPGARIHTMLYDPAGTFPEFANHEVVVSPLNRSSFLRRNHRFALPALAYAASRMVVDADVVLASSSGWAHGVHATGRKLVYCHAPARWVYATDDYLGPGGRRSAKGLALAAMLPALRRWDRSAAATADRYLANSSVVRGRIRAAYGIEADVVFPPQSLAVDGRRDPVPALVDWSGEGFHLVVSRLLPYKHVDVVVDAFRSTGERLVVVGAGPLAEQLRASAPPNVRLVQDLTDAQLRWTYAGATALVAASYEDFGLTPLEAMAFGVPTVALRAGGYLDTVVEGTTGVFFDVVTPAAIRQAVAEAAAHGFDPAAVLARAADFSEAAFAARIRSVVDELGAQTG